MPDEKDKLPKSNSKIYNTIIRSVDKIVPASLRPLWIHPAGPQTVFFWGPLFKWGLVIASLSDISSRPPELISIPQCISLALTGFIWARYSLIIIPRNLSLLSVNLGVAILNCIQCLRGINCQLNAKKN